MKSASILDTSSKITSAILVSILLLSSILSFTLVNAAIPPEASDPDYMKDYGLLHNDTYILYPWAEKSIDIGFSKYGEMINPGPPSLGLKYGTVDVFASDALAPYEWSNGWLIDIHYVDNGLLQRVWAYALYSDLDTAGGPWQQKQHYPNGTHPLDTNGGRRTSGWCVTDPIRVIYDGPRKAIYLLRTIIHDDDPAADGIALIRLDIQLVFNKVKKYIIEIKDIKRLEESKWTGPMQVEFSQRGEWDVGTTRVCNSYAEFYDDLVTVYDKHPFYGPYPAWTTANKTRDVTVYYDLAQIISTEAGVDLVAWAAYWPSLISKYVTKTYGLDRDMVLTSLETLLVEYIVPSDQVNATNALTRELRIDLPYNAIFYPRGAGIWDDTPWVFKGPNKAELDSTKWRWSSPKKVFILPTHWAAGQTFWVLYKRERKGMVTQTDSEPRACSRDLFAGSPETVISYGMDEEPRVPYIMGEWDFELSFNDKERSTHHFRCATVYGVTDNSDAEDPDDNAPTKYFMIDSEVQYQLNEIFNPWDLYDAAHKDKFRWAQKGSIPPIGVAITLRAHLHDKYYNTRECLLDEHDLVKPPKWTEYCEDSEKVVLYDMNGTKEAKLLIPYRSYLAVDGVTNYDYTYDATAGTITFRSSAVYSGYEYYKVLYSTDQDETVPSCWDTGRWEWIIVGRDSKAVDSAGAAMVSIAWEEWKKGQVWLSALDMRDDIYGPTVPYVLRQFTDVYDMWWDYTYYENNYRVAFKDDWCQPPFDNIRAYYDKTGSFELYPYAVSSANVIVVGGPYANKAAWYFNDFTDAFVESKYEPGFYAPGCWARTSQPTVVSVSRWGTPNMEKWIADELWYNSTTIDDARGHAIISTYKDLNGTVGFIIYGYTGEDTYYATYAFRGGLLLWLQHLQRGTTTLILELDYEYMHPELGSKYYGIHPIGIHVQESLGTITECTGFGYNFKTHANKGAIAAAKTSLEGTASSYGLCYKLVDITWCAQVHPDP